MYGWRGKIGHVAPSRGDLLVYEFYRMLGDGFMILNTTGTIRKLVDTDFDKQIQRFEDATLDLVSSGADVVIVGGAPLFAKLGYGAPPGMILSAKALLDKIPAPSREDVVHYMEGNLCRCTGYKSILDSILAA